MRFFVAPAASPPLLLRMTVLSDKLLVPFLVYVSVQKQPVVFSLSRVISPKRHELVFERGPSARYRFVSYAKVQRCMIILSLLQAEF